MDIAIGFGTFACYRRDGCRALAGLIVMAMMCSPVVAAESDYLSQLDSEAEEVTDSAIVDEIDQKWREKFEYRLQEERPSTFEMYSKLDLDKQDKIVADYRLKKRLSHSSMLIIDFYTHAK